MKKPSFIKADPFAYLATLQSWQLKHLAFLTGLKLSGTKIQLKATLSESSAKPFLRSPSHRILSVDMGVKNLAFCLLDINQKNYQSEALRRSHNGNNQISLHLSDWKRLDVSERLISQSKSTRDSFTSESVGAQPEDEATEVASTEQLNLYTPSSLSKIAFKLASEFIHHKPDTILIERQRFRSGGAPAIQEWTVRVNMLESMLWAALETMSHGHGVQTSNETSNFPEVNEMNPRRIGLFWLARGTDNAAIPADIATAMSGPKESVQASESALAKRSFEKKDKIALARHWLSPESTDLSVHPDLASMVNSFCNPRAAAKGKRRKKGTQVDDEVVAAAAEVSSSPGKLDDLADCLVQAVTFAMWEQSRMHICDFIGSQK